jgi:hypothetical protein
MSQSMDDMPGGEGSFEELTAFLLNHADVAAERAHAKLGGPLTVETLEQYLADADCLRYPTTVAWDAAGIEANQFAEPTFQEGPEGRICTLKVHPRFRHIPEALPYFVAYMAAVINYGQVVAPEVCEAYGAALVGITKDEYYNALCGWMDAADGG